MAILLSQVSLFDITSLSFFSPTEKSFDFQSSDFYQQVAHARDERILDNKIVVVPIDNLSRSEIAQLVEDVEQCSPIAIGLDVIFQYATADDSLLQAVIDRTPTLVLPTGVYAEEGEPGQWMLMKTLKFAGKESVCYGVANLNILHPYNVVRSFVPFYGTDKGVVPNFAVALASYADTTVLHDDELRNHEEVYINYPSREFDIIPPDAVLERYEDIENKIVLLGALTESQDLHATPIVDAMSGVLIHAHALATIIHKSYVKELPRAVLWILAFLLCVIFVATNALLNRYPAGNMLMRLFQLTMLYVTIVMGCVLFIKYQLIFELSIPLLLIALGIMALDFWNGIVWIFEFIINKIKKL